MYKEREILYFLQTIPGIGNKSIRELWQYFGDGAKIFQADEEQLQQVLKPGQVKAFLREREKADPKERLTKLEQKGIRYYSLWDKDYPKRLQAVADLPLSLFVKGSLPTETVMTASVVGARNHSYYGEKHTRIFAGLLAEAGVGVVSGMARGIDSIAQKTAIERGGKTYAVLGCGVDVCYPEENLRLYERIPEHGGIISEYLPGTLPKAGLFPMRNRIISALGDILLVMEARERSGTLITVDMALEQGKEIWALPGRTDDVLSFGCNRLIAQGAGILTGISEFSKELELLKEKYGRDETAKMPAEKGDDGSKDKPQMSDTEKKILSVLEYQPMSLDNVYEKLQGEKDASESVQTISCILLDLCMKGMAKQVNSNWYIRV